MSAGWRSERSKESLGGHKVELRPPTGNAVAGLILGLALVLGGIFVVAYLIRQVVLPGGRPPGAIYDWIGFVALIIMGLAGVVGGALLIQFSRSLVGFRLVLCDHGFWLLRSGQPIVFAWDEIVSVKESIAEERLPILQGGGQLLNPKREIRAYSVVRCDGETFDFDENILERPSALAGPLAVAAAEYGIEWETVRQCL